MHELPRRRNPWPWRKPRQAAGACGPSEHALSLCACRGAKEHGPVTRRRPTRRIRPAPRPRPPTRAPPQPQPGSGLPAQRPWGQPPHRLTRPAFRRLGHGPCSPTPRAYRSAKPTRRRNDTLALHLYPGHAPAPAVVRGPACPAPVHQHPCQDRAVSLFRQAVTSSANTVRACKAAQSRMLMYLSNHQDRCESCLRAPRPCLFLNVRRVARPQPASMPLRAAGHRLGRWSHGVAPRGPHSETARGPPRTAASRPTCARTATTLLGERKSHIGAACCRYDPVEQRHRVARRRRVIKHAGRQMQHISDRSPLA